MSDSRPRSDRISTREFLEARIQELEGQMHRRLQDLLHRLEKQAQRGDEQIGEVKELLDRSRQENLRLQTLESEHTQTADQALSKRLDEMNGLRRQIEQERALFVDRDRLEAFQQAIDRRFDSLAGRIETAERGRANLDGRLSAVGFMLFGASVVINLVITMVSHFLGR